MLAWKASKQSNSTTNLESPIRNLVSSKLFNLLVCSVFNSTKINWKKLFLSISSGLQVPLMMIVVLIKLFLCTILVLWCIRTAEDSVMKRVIPTMSLTVLDCLSTLNTLVTRAIFAFGAAGDRAALSRFFLDPPVSQMAPRGHFY